MCNSTIGFGIAAQIYFSKYYHLQSVRFELHIYSEKSSPSSLVVWDLNVSSVEVP